jgi:3-methyladenine DNA glycosylase AlkD
MNKISPLLGEDYADQLMIRLREHKNKETAAPMEAYMRNQFSFLGIKTPDRNALIKEFFREGIVSLEELETAVTMLWDQPEREFQYAAMNLLDKHQKSLSIQHIPLLEKLILSKSWWDTIDHLSPHNIGGIILKDHASFKDKIQSWIDSENIWLNRTAILYQLKYKEKTDEQELYRIIRSFSTSKEFFIQKAMGWSLREYSYREPQSVRFFIESETLPALTKREGMKQLNRQKAISN